jgi:hypothetical protein
MPCDVVIVRTWIGSEADVCLDADADADALLTVLLLPGCCWVEGGGGGALYGPSVVDEELACPGPATNCIPPPACANVVPGK